jgi:hypothetical protein
VPNNRWPDYVVPHKHSGSDVPNLGPFLFPPTQVAVGVASGPTTASSTFALLTDMSLTVTPPSIYPLWEVYLRFIGQFSNATAASATKGVQVRLCEIDAATVIVNTTRQGGNVGNGASFPLVLVSEATRVIKAGTAVLYTVQWAGITNAETATATGVARRFEATLRPYAGAA